MRDIVSKKPKVSIVSICYNQENFIEETLKGFLIQKTKFDVEIIIGDDCSTDNTPKILKDFKKNHPELNIQLVLRKKNVGAPVNALDVISRAQGKYIAICEGDDFWTDLTKLQRQVDFLDKHPDYTMCFHPVRVFFEGGKEKDSIHPEVAAGSRFTLSELLDRNYMHTNSVLFRNRDFSAIPGNTMPLDWYLNLYNAQFGKIGFINKVMSAYRRHPGGIWWSSYDDNDNFWKKHGLMHLNFYNEVLNLYGDNPKYRKKIFVYVYYVFDRIVEMDKKYRRDDLKKAIVQFPDISHEYVLHLSRLSTDREYALHEQNLELVRMRSQFDARQHIVADQEAMLRGMKASKFWRARNKAARIVGREVI